MTRVNLWAEITEEAHGQIEAVAIGAGEWSFLDAQDEGDPRRIDPALLGKVMSAAEAAPLLDYEYDNGYGGVDCHAVYAWTADRVLFVSVYDGSSYVASLPRNPRDGMPETYGGG